MIAKKGSSLPVEEIVKIIIGVGVFIFILFVIFTLSKLVMGNLQEEQARNTLDNIVYEISKLDDGQTKEIIIESPKDWALIGRGKELCFCEISSALYPSKTDVGTSSSLDASFAVCKQTGICKDANMELIFSQTKCAPYGKWLSGSKYSEVLNCLSISRVPLSVTLERNKETVNIYSKESTYTGTDVTGWGAQNENCRISNFSYDSSLGDNGQSYVLPYLLLNFSDCNLGILSASKVDFFLKCLTPFGSSEFHYPSDPSINSCESIEVSQEKNFARFTSCAVSKSLLKESSSSSCELGVTINWIGTQSQEKVNGEWVERTTKADFSNLDFLVNPGNKKCEIYSIKRYAGIVAKTQHFFTFETDCDFLDFKLYLNALTTEQDESNYFKCNSQNDSSFTPYYYNYLKTLEMLIDPSSGSHNIIKVSYPYPTDGDNVCDNFVFYYKGQEFPVDFSS